jgi:ABC-type oligopeptide transport system substrate-binding subunit
MVASRKEENVRQTHKLWNIGIALAFAGALTLSASVPGSAHPAGKGLPTIRMGYLANNPKWVPTLDPQMVTDTASSDATHMIYSNLVQLTPGAKVTGDLASHWTVSKNLKVYTFFLRPHLRFADGHPLTASDVVWSIRRALSAKTNSPVNYYDSLIKGYDAYSSGKSSSLGVKALNSSTVQITLSDASVYFVYALTYPTNDILEKRIAGGHPADTYLTTTCKADAADANGPFKPVCVNNSSNDVTSFYRAGSTPTLTLVPNKYYYGHKPKVKVVLPAIDSVNTAYADYLSGSLVETSLPTSYIAKWKGKPGYFHYAGSGIEYISLDLTSPPFDNVHCRLAVAYAIDRVTLTQKVLHGAYIPLYTMVPKGFLGYYSGSDNPHYSASKAKSELSQCSGGINVDYVYRHDTTDHEAEAAAVQGMLSNVGIHFNLKGMTRADWLKIVQKPMSQTGTKATYDDWFMDYPDPQDYCDILMHSDSTYNIGGWKNKQYDHLVEQARSETNRTKRAQLYVKAQHIVLSQGAWIALTNFANFNLVKPSVHGFVGSYSQGDVWPVNNDWSKVTVK